MMMFPTSSVVVVVLTMKMVTMNKTPENLQTLQLSSMCELFFLLRLPVFRHGDPVLQ